MAELQYLQWQRQFLDIKTPVSGGITTKHVEIFIGKNFKTGEPFSEIAVPKESWAEICVPKKK